MELMSSSQTFPKSLQIVLLQTKKGNHKNWKTHVMKVHGQTHVTIFIELQKLITSSSLIDSILLQSFLDLGDDLSYDGSVKKPDLGFIVPGSQGKTAKPKGQAQKLEDPSVERPDSGDNIHRISKPHQR